MQLEALLYLLCMFSSNPTASQHCRTQKRTSVVELAKCVIQSADIPIHSSTWGQLIVAMKQNWSDTMLRVRHLKDVSVATQNTCGQKLAPICSHSLVWCCWSSESFFVSCKLVETYWSSCEPGGYDLQASALNLWCGHAVSTYMHTLYILTYIIHTSTQTSCVPNKNVAIPSSRYKYTYSYIHDDACTTYTVEYGLLGSSYFTSTVFTLPVWYLYVAIDFPLTTSQWTTDVSPDAVIWWLDTQDGNTGTTK